MNRRSLLSAAAAASLAGAPFARALAQASGPVVRVADAPGDPYEEGYFADAQGFFKRSGLNVEFTSFASGTPIQTAVVTGNMDIGIVTPLAVANAVTHGVPCVMIAPGGVNSAKAPTGYLCVTKNSTLNTAQDFVGKPIALASLKTLHELMVRSWFDRSGVDQSKLTIVEMTFSEMAPALARGTIAGGVMVEPVVSGLVASGDIRVVPGPRNAIGEEILGGSWFCMRDYAQKNPEVVRKFVAMMAEVARWANSHKDEAGDIEARVGKFDPQKVRGMARVTYAETLLPAQIQPILDAASKFNILPRKVTAAELML